MKVRIYQLKSAEKIPENAYKLYMAFSAQNEKTLTPEIYDEVYAYTCPELSDFNNSTVQAKLEKIYINFNMDNKPKKFRGRSMSVSDVVVFESEIHGTSAWFCDSVGFERIMFDNDTLKRM